MASGKVGLNKSTGKTVGLTLLIVVVFLWLINNVSFANETAKEVGIIKY